MRSLSLSVIISVLVNSTGFLFLAPHAHILGVHSMPTTITRQLRVDSASSPKTTWLLYCYGRASPTVTGSVDIQAEPDELQRQ